ncbi:MAG: tRNA wybutosine-synthesizing 3 family protein [archaeon]
MNFDHEKEQTLKKMVSNDQSNKGSVDKPIKKLLNNINRTKNHYSTSSCSGRIILIQIPKSGRKQEAEFLYRTHSKAKLKDVLAAIKKIKGSNAVWFRQEAAILHIASRTLNDASKFLRVARAVGFKRSGLFEVKKHFLMELIATEKLETIIMRHGELLVDEKYLKVLVEESNKKMESTWDKIKKLELAVKKL